ncbi:hypothetical protein [Metabacillus litoralis]|uniref:hypothetical protein n=1 Tax=Metabacillus litoralis TaxID=152268 RepID=UPI00203EF022|nr:hypothetical protein [Metabacillus litoralis]MCM3413533.1 hypothetical protein [Metabacillus litoralis]
MKPKEQLYEEAEGILEAIGERIKLECNAPLCAEDINALSGLTDSYCRLFELVK